MSATDRSLPAPSAGRFPVGLPAHSTMPRVRRTLFNLAAAVSLVLLAAIIAFWIRAQFSGDLVFGMKSATALNVFSFGVSDFRHESLHDASGRFLSSVGILTANSPLGVAKDFAIPLNERSVPGVSC